MKQFVVITICFFLITHTGQAFAEVNLAELVNKIQPAVVTIFTYDKEMKHTGQGSGFFINSMGHVITNYHVLTDAYAATVKTLSGKIYPIKSIIAENQDMDLIKVLVDMPTKPSGWLTIAKTLPSLADRIFVIGSPMGLEQTVSEGIVSSIREIPNIGTILQISAPVSPGSSGGPVVDMRGQVVGVVTFYLIKGQNLNFATPSRYLTDLKPLKSRLFVNAEPKGAGIRILNIKPKFYQGVELNFGKYHIEVTAPGYETKKMWIIVEAGEDKKLEISLKKLPRENKEFVDKWNKWQQVRKKEYEKVQQIDKSRYLNPDEKVEVWRRFLAEVKIDNPFSNEDDAMRFYAQSRLSHWQSKIAVPPKPPTPDATAITPPDLEVEREGHYIKYKSGVVWDTKTGLEWVAGWDGSTSWDDAKRWVEKLNIAGGDWRMPAIDELETLYEEGRKDTNMTPLLKISGWKVWSGETEVASARLYFSFLYGNSTRVWNYHKSIYLFDFRAFAVRSRPSAETQQEQKTQTSQNKVVDSKPKTKVKVRDGFWKDKIWQPPIYK